MTEFLLHLSNLIDEIEDKALRDNVYQIYQCINTCGEKMTSATKFIDFFVHDILDYTILNQDEQNFTKNITIFNLKTAVQEIIDTLNDKAEMKEINVSVEYKGFCEDGSKGQYLVKSD